MIDRIETNIEQAAHWTQEGVREVIKCVNIANQRVYTVIVVVHGILCLWLCLALASLHILFEQFIYKFFFYSAAKDMLLLLVGTWNTKLPGILQYQILPIDTTIIITLLLIIS